MEETTDAAAIFAPLWKRKWLILAVGLIVGVLTYVYYDHKQPTYGASTSVYLGGSSEIQALLGYGTSSAESERSLADQVTLINSEPIGSAVRQKLLSEHDVVAAEGHATATEETGSDFISITAEAHSPQGAANLANTYAETYLKQRDNGYREHIETAIKSTREQLKAARAGATTPTQEVQVQNLVNRFSQLHAQLSLGDAGDRQIDKALPNPVALSPKPKRDAIFGFAIGIVLAALAAYTLSRLDRRLRSLSDIEDVFKLPVIAAVPSIRKPISRSTGVPTPAPALREPLRRLHTTLQLRSMEDDLERRVAPQCILLVSADAGDGKSTLAAGLALVQSEAGARVAIVESDLRRPIQGKLLGLNGGEGLAEVLAGRATAQGAMQKVPGIDSVSSEGDAQTVGRSEATIATAVHRHEGGTVSVLTSGAAVANPPALLAKGGMPSLLRSISQDFDYVIIDAPPPLAVSDVLPLMAMVDAIVLVARADHTSRTSAQRLIDLLGRAAHAPVIGVVANDVSSAELEAFGFSSAYYYQAGNGASRP